MTTETQSHRDRSGWLRFVGAAKRRQCGAAALKRKAVLASVGLAFQRRTPHEPAYKAGRRRSTHSRLCASVPLWLLILCVSVAGCRQDMHDQPKYIPLRESTFFADGRSARAPVAGTVARDELHEDALLYTGKLDGRDATVFPFPVDEKVMARGQERYDIYCSPCHGRTGTGDGMIVRRGYRPPPTLHADRLRLAPVGHFFDVITTGFGAMPDYAAQIRAEDRWAIVAYIRALQLSEHATVADVPADQRGALQ